MTLRESLAYSPVELAFGTSGLRGLVVDLTQLEVAINTVGFLHFLRDSGQLAKVDRVAVAGDLRPSTAGGVEVDGRRRGGILPAVAWAVQHTGLQVVNLGQVPTPAVLHYALRLGLPSVMVTGSHIPFDRNGIKFNRVGGEVLKTDEAAILASIRRVRDQFYALKADRCGFTSEGMLREPVALPPITAEGEAGYRQRYLAALPEGVFRGRRVLVYQHSAVGRDLLVDVLRALGADVTAAGRSEQFIPIDTEAVSLSMMGEIQRLVDGHGGRELEAVVSTDGDSDRPLVLAVDDGRVQFLGGDLLGALVAEALGARHVAVPISTNDAVDRFLATRGITVVKTRIGSPYVIAAMREVGWEANGGFLTACPTQLPGGEVLTPLPTRDAFLPVLAVLAASLGRGLRLSELLARLPQRFGKSDLVREFPRETSREILRLFEPATEPVEEVRFTPAGPWFRRPGSTNSGAAVGALAGELQRCAATWQRFFEPRLGFGTVEWMNYLDGVRVGMTGGDIVHLRPSGNAPEFRIYVNADTADRAGGMARGFLEDGGILNRLRDEIRVRSALSLLAETPQPWLVRGAVQSYAWGGHQFIPQLLGCGNPEDRPWAELWLGAHPAASASVEFGGQSVRLHDLVRWAPDLILGPDLAARYGDLPFLLKVLDAAEMLSIQAHPNREQARAGFERENAAGIPLESPRRNYRDPHPKPEVHVALTPFWLLHGFRPLEAIAETLERIPELSPVMPGFRKDLDQAGANPAERSGLLRRLYERVMTMPQPVVDTVLRPLVRRLEREAPVDKALAETWFLRAARQYAPADGSCDRGLFSIFLLNLVNLQPGEGTFQGAGVLHAYLEGANVELMAGSDNVLRGGLTPKYVDVSELLGVLTFQEGAPAILRGSSRCPTETVFPTPAEEFELSRLGLGDGLQWQAPPRSGPDCLLLLAGTARLRSRHGEIPLRQGQSIFVPHGTDYDLSGVGAWADVMRAAVPKRPPTS